LFSRFWKNKECPLVGSGSPELRYAATVKVGIKVKLLATKCGAVLVENFIENDGPIPWLKTKLNAVMGVDPFTKTTKAFTIGEWPWRTNG